MVSDKDTKKAPPHETALKTSGDDGKQAVAKKPSYDDELHSLYTQESKFTSDPDGFGHLPPDERPFPIEPMPNERERLPFKMTDEDRMRRKIYLKSLELTDREPAYVPEIETMIYNPVRISSLLLIHIAFMSIHFFLYLDINCCKIRRFYRVPTDKLFKALGPFIGQERVPLFRVLVPKFFILWMGGCVLWYNLKYGRQVSEAKESESMSKNN